MTRKTPETAPEAAAEPVDRQPTTAIACPFELPQVGGAFVLAAGAKTPKPEAAEAPVETTVKEA